MKNYVPHVIGEQGISLLTTKGMEAIPVTHPNYAAIIEKLRSDDHSNIEDLLNIPDQIADATDGQVRIVGDKLMYRGRELHDNYSKRIIRLNAEGVPVQYMLDFLTNLQKNPSKQAREELALFLEHANIPLTQDGHFLAWKRVNPDYTSIHDGRTDNTPGSTPEMPREAVDDDRRSTCSQGLHFAAFGYLDHYASEHNTKTVILKIHPADVVSIPFDYNNMKGRACRYLVVGEIGQGITHDDMNRAAIVNTDGSAFKMPERDLVHESEEDDESFDPYPYDDREPELDYSHEDQGTRYYTFGPAENEVRIREDIFGHQQIVIRSGDKEWIKIDTGHPDLSNAENIAEERCRDLFDN